MTYFGTMSHPLITNNSYVRNAAGIAHNKLVSGVTTSYGSSKSPAADMETLMLSHFHSDQFKALMTGELAAAMLKMHVAVADYRTFQHAQRVHTLADDFASSELAFDREAKNRQPTVTIQMAVYAKGSKGTRLLIPVETNMKLHIAHVHAKPASHGAPKHNAWFSQIMNADYDSDVEYELDEHNKAYYQGQLKRLNKEPFVDHIPYADGSKLHGEITTAMTYQIGAGALMHIKGVDADLHGTAELTAKHYDHFMYPGTRGVLPKIATECGEVYLGPFMERVCPRIIHGVKSVLRKHLVAGEILELAHVASEGYIQFTKKAEPQISHPNLTKLMKAPEMIRIQFTSAPHKVVPDRELDVFGFSRVEQETKKVLADMDNATRRPKMFMVLFMTALLGLREYYHLSDMTYVDKVHMLALLWQIKQVSRQNYSVPPSHVGPPPSYIVVHAGAGHDSRNKRHY